MFHFAIWSLLGQIGQPEIVEAFEASHADIVTFSHNRPNR